MLMAYGEEDAQALGAAGGQGGVDVLLLSLGTTPGLRIADAELVEMLREAGASVAVSAVRFGWSGHLRVGYPLNDLIEGHSARRALKAAIARHRPRALILATCTTTLLADPEGLPFAPWFDSLGRASRRGPQNLVIHILERRSFARARVLLPWSEPARESLSGEVAPSFVISPPIAKSGVSMTEPREDLVVAYTPEPKGKGLELVCRAWALACPHVSARLVLAGISPSDALPFLEERGVDLPERIEIAGLLKQSDFHALLARARVLLSGAKWEDFGQAPLEALDRGAVFVTAPGGGPSAALSLARELDGRFVASDMSPEALAEALQAGLGVSDSDLADYCKRALGLLDPYRREHVVGRLREEVLPLLLS
jgi:hypothetical protein